MQPANIMLDATGHVNLGDFGTACTTTPSGETNASTGTLAYMPPEYLSGSHSNQLSEKV